ncbi:unnamed protein product [Bursaphelenchus okinawaensis]|uniref:Phospholipid/glycerol acyltransferase domain-containing protein n=1 Tax=Bursaphelenchus okinawaensis TaxID=465554 RepID=A0A811JQZ8_9BILA|nr:unnamed protein product [Bursaphelenchus okinawaensis]CAG9078366.1 unnamed protein product [Bursaphelenchus okinawaensis]
MPVLSVLTTVVENRAWLPAGMLASIMVPYATGALCCGALSWLIPKKWYLWLDNRMYDIFMSSCLFVFENCNATKLHLYGKPEALYGLPDSAILISNHQSGADWVLINMLAQRHAQQYSFRFIVKHVIQYVPLYGWYTLQRGFVYVRRFGEFIPTAPKNQLQYLRDLPEPVWLHIFPEGTRFNKHRTKEIQEAHSYCRKRELVKLNHLLIPKIGGFKLALTELRPTLNCIYDITIGYGLTLDEYRQDDAPNMYEFVTGRSERHNEVHVHIDRIPIEQVPVEGNELKAWLHQRFVEKDRLMAQFYSTGRFPDPAETPSKLTPLKRTATSFLLMNAAVWAALFCPKVRRVYCYTIAISPLLIIWTKLRRSAA